MKYVKANGVRQRLRKMGNRSQQKKMTVDACKTGARELNTLMKPEMPEDTGFGKRKQTVRVLRSNTLRSKYWGARATLERPKGPDFYMFYQHFGWTPARHSDFTHNFKKTHTVTRREKVKQSSYTTTTDRKTGEEIHKAVTRTVTADFDVRVGRDTAANRARARLRRQGNSAGRSGRKAGIKGNVRFRNQNLHGNYVPGVHWGTTVSRKNAKRIQDIVAKEYFFKLMGV